MNDKLKALAEKIAAKEAVKKAILAEHKPAKGKKLTLEQRLARLEELAGIKDE